MEITHPKGGEPQGSLVETKAPPPGAPVQRGTPVSRPAGPTQFTQAPEAARVIQPPPEPARGAGAQGGRIAALEAAHEALSAAHDGLTGIVNDIGAAGAGLAKRIAELELRVFGQTAAPEEPAPAGESAQKQD